MALDDRNLVETLKSELNFLNKGGYGRSPRTPWKPQLIFEDSPICMNYDSKENPRPCSECLLMQFVPPDSRNEEIPCRHIVLNQEGQSIASFYQYGSQTELEDSLRNWLALTIAKLERQSSNSQACFSGLALTIAKLEKQSSNSQACSNCCGTCEPRH